MATPYLTLRNAAPAAFAVSTLTGSTLSGNTLSGNSLNVSTLTGTSITGTTLSGTTLSASTLTVPQLSVTSTIMALGANAGATKTNFSQGSYAAGSWQTAQTGLTTVKKLAVSSTGQYQLVVSAGTVYLSSDSGVTWSALTAAANGLPTGATWSHGAISATGQYQMLTDSNGGLVWVSNDYGASFNNTSPAGVTPYAWFKFNNSTTDSLGNSTATLADGWTPTYTTGITPGQNAIILSNTAGSTATQYVRGTWTLPSAGNCTISFWLNLQTVNGTSQLIFSYKSAAFQVFLYSDNYLYANFPTGGSTNSVNIRSTFTATANTWYFVTLIFQTNGLCSFYINNVLMGSITNTNGIGSYTGGSVFSLGTYDTIQSLAFNGYIDDFKIYNTAITYQAVPFIPPYVWFKFENNTTDSGSANSTPSVTGSLTYVTGVVGSNAVNLANTPGVAATKYMLINWSGGSNNVTFSFWMNPQSLGATTLILSSCAGAFAVLMNTSNQLYVNIPTGGGSNYSTITTSFSLSSNTWYYIYVIFQTGGLCSFYVNNTLIGSLTNTSGFGSYSLTTFGLSIYDTGYNPGIPFNGYIDSLRIYNTAIPYNPMSPMNYNGAALSGSGQYLLASATSGQLLSSSNYGVSWSNQPSVVTTVGSLALSHSGQYQLVASGGASGLLMPNMSGLAANTWSQGGVSWTASASSIYDQSFPAYNIFNNNHSSTANSWSSGMDQYNGTTGVYTINTVTTTVLGGIGSVSGEWIQLQSSIPLVIQSYSWACGAFQQVPKNYYLVGSNDGSNWYPIQYVSLSVNPLTVSNTATSSSLLVNITGTQTIQGGTTGSGTTTSYPFSTQSFMYFRMIINTIWPSNFGSAQLGELYLNFQNAAAYSTNYGSTWNFSSNQLACDAGVLSGNGQYAISTDTVTPYARLTLDNTNADGQGALTPTTGAGTVTYSNSVVKVGTHSALFSNTAGSTTPANYLNYTVPAALNTPPMLTMACWVYPTSLSANSTPLALNAGSTSYDNHFYITASGVVNLWWTTTSSTGGNALTSTATIAINTWSHLAMTFSSGTFVLYVNGVQVASVASSGRLCVNAGGNITNIFVGAAMTTNNAFAGYVDDVRIYTSALNASQVASLYNNPPLTQAIGVSNTYLPITSSTTPILPSIANNITGSASSFTGQYMVVVTSGSANNVYYSTNYGATWSALTIGSAGMVSCSMSYDGSYLTVSSATATYTLNANSTGYTLAVGSQAGQTNQAQNAIAIGNKAGQINQAANSIVLNASGAAVNAASQGFYVAPIAQATSTASGSLQLLGYGADQQIVQSGVTLTTGSSSRLSIINNQAPYTQALLILDVGTAGNNTIPPPRGIGQPLIRLGWASYTSGGPGAAGDYYGIGFGYGPSTSLAQPCEIGCLITNTYGAEIGDLVFSTRPNFNAYDIATERMRITSSGNVGIGTILPSSKLHVYGGLRLDTRNPDYTTTLSAAAYTGGTWYQFIPNNVLTINVTYLIRAYWIPSPGTSPWVITFSFLYTPESVNDTNTSAMAGHPVLVSSNGVSTDYQIYVRGLPGYGNIPQGIQFKCNSSLPTGIFTVTAQSLAS